MGVCEGGLQSSGKGLGMEGREVARSSSSRRRFLGPKEGRQRIGGLQASALPSTEPPPNPDHHQPHLSSIHPLYLVGMGRGWDLVTSPGRGASGGGGVPGGVPGARYRSSGELLS